MVRAPCCEKMGLKKGPWTPEEDHVLINYIQRYGHGNWRALPKQAGLLRCGKSCRLRWTNYLRPDIKRGNFSREEEDTIIKLHEMLGNRWSAIAARLPGRTDNEIKNVWHTHLKKRLKQNQATQEDNRFEISKCIEANTTAETEPISFPTQSRIQNPSYVPISPQECSSNSSSGTDSSSVITGQNHDMGIKEDYTVSSEDFLEIDENFWSEALSPGYFLADPQLQSPLSPVCMSNPYSNMDDGMDFWYSLLVKAEELPKL